MSQQEHTAQKFTRPINEGLVVIDYGSQYTMLIARRLREIGVYVEVIHASAAAPEDFMIHGIILSGGPDSVSDADARTLPAWVLQSKKPILGICYGMQLLVHTFTGKVRQGKGREYGRSILRLSADLPQRAAQIFYDMPVEQHVWMSHGDDVEVLPQGFSAIGHTGDGVCAVMVHDTLPIVGLQFHPEVNHTDCGAKMLHAFVTKLCRAPLHWTPVGMLEATSRSIRESVGPNDRVLMAVSGGVDSTVAAVLLHRVLGPERVVTVFVDHGLLRANERQWVADNFRFAGIKNLQVLARDDYFLDHLKGVTDPEEKRKIIGKCFIDVFQEYAKTLPGITHLGQGTLYPDVIESAGHGSGSKVIKTHHNVGGLPEHLHLKLVEPFRFLFKDEVRAIGNELGLNAGLVLRHPFPGPGLAIRVLGEVDKASLDLLRAADKIFVDALQTQKLYDQVWQAFVVLLPHKSVGVMGDNRTYERTVCLRAVEASDGMTAAVAKLPMDFLLHVAEQITRKVPGINRVVYDITSKPPATIEWE